MVEHSTADREVSGSIPDAPFFAFSRLICVFDDLLVLFWPFRGQQRHKNYFDTSNAAEILTNLTFQAKALAVRGQRTLFVGGKVHCTEDHQFNSIRFDQTIKWVVICTHVQKLLNSNQPNLRHTVQWYFPLGYLFPCSYGCCRHITSRDVTDNCFKIIKIIKNLAFEIRYLPICRRKPGQY